MLRRAFVLALVLGLTTALGSAWAQGPATASPDGKLRAVGDGKSIKVFDVATGKEIIKIAAHKDDVTTLIYGPDGKKLYSADAGGTVLGIDAATGKLLWQSVGKAKVTGLSVSGDGKTVTATAGNKTLEYDAATGKLLSEK